MPHLASKLPKGRRKHWSPPCFSGCRPRIRGSSTHPCASGPSSPRFPPLVPGRLWKGQVTIGGLEPLEAKPGCFLARPFRIDCASRNTAGMPYPGLGTAAARGSGLVRGTCDRSRSRDRLVLCCPAHAIQIHKSTWAGAQKTHREHCAFALRPCRGQPATVRRSPCSRATGEGVTVGSPHRGRAPPHGSRNPFPEQPPAALPQVGSPRPRATSFHRAGSRDPPFRQGWGSLRPSCRCRASRGWWSRIALAIHRDLQPMGNSKSTPLCSILRPVFLPQGAVSRDVQRPDSPARRSAEPVRVIGCVAPAFFTCPETYQDWQKLCILAQKASLVMRTLSRITACSSKPGLTGQGLERMTRRPRTPAPLLPSGNRNSYRSCAGFTEKRG